MDEISARVAKLQAETAEILARTERAAEEAALRRERDCLRLRSMTATVEKSEAAAVYERVMSNKALRDEKLLLADWRYDHTINFAGSVGRDTVGPTIDKLHQFSVTDPGCDITRTFNSPGGSVIDGMALFDFIRFLRDQGHRVTIIALGYAASMAGILLQAADVRVMARGSWLLIHEVTFGAAGKIGEVEDTYEFGKRLKEQAAQIFIERSQGKLTREVLDKNWTRKDWWLNADEALELGLVDEIR